MDLEMKNLIEQSNRLVETLRSEQKADAEKVARLEGDLARVLSEKSALETRIADVETKAARPGAFGADARPDEHKTAFINFLRKSQDAGARAELEAKAASVNVSGPDGNGFAVPRVIASEVLVQMKPLSPIRDLATVVSVSTSEYVELVDRGNAGAVWVGEMDARGTTAAPDLGQVRPKFGEIHATVEVSTQALQDYAFDVESWLVSSLAKRFAELEARSFIDGDGANKPLGLLKGTFDEVNSGAAESIGDNPHENLIGLMYGVNSAYRKDGSFLMNSGTLARLMKVKNAAGDYIYTPALALGMSDTLLGKRIAVCEDMPAVAAGSAPVAFGDIARAYLIADRVGFSLIVDPYTKPGFVKFTAARRVGGTPRDEAALNILRVSA